MSEPPVVNIHTPTSSFALVHSITQDSLLDLYDKLSRKGHTDYYGERVASGWLKYQWNDAFWQLDDDGDYTIFVWRQKSSFPDPTQSPTIHLRNPSVPLPSPPAYRNPSFYLFHPNANLVQPHSDHVGHHPLSVRSSKTDRSRKSKHRESVDSPSNFRKEFDKFHSENGVRTIKGSIGPINDVRMLLKNGYRHVYMSRKFAIRHGFIPKDAALGHYGYSGLVNIGSWPIRLNILTPEGEHAQSSVTTTHTVYLAEESHFDVVLGRSFMEKRQIRTDPTDPTDVQCLDSKEKVDCEVVVLKDGRGQIVTVT